MAHRTDLALITADGVSVAARCYTPGSGAARASVVVAGATGVPQGFYRGWASDLADRGFAVWTVDYRGIGASRPSGSLRGFAASMQDWGRRDLQAAFDAVDPALPVLFVGHSFGGQALGLVPGGARIVGGLTIGAQLGWYGHWPRSTRWGYAALWTAAPLGARALGYWPGRLGIGEDLPAGVAIEWSRWCRSPNYLLDHVADARDRFAAVTAPLRVIAISDDPYAPEPAVRAFAAALPRARLDRWTPSAAGATALGHFGFFRPGGRRLWDDAAATLELAADRARRTA